VSPDGDWSQATSASRSKTTESSQFTAQTTSHRTSDTGGPRQAGWAADHKRPSTSPTPKTPLRTSASAKFSGGPASPTATEGVKKPEAWARPRAKVAEDIESDPHRKPPPPFHKQETRSGPGFRRGSSFTDDNTDGDGWVKTVDSASGRPYWFHRQTLETRWDKPPSATSTSESKPRKTERSKTQGIPKAPSSDYAKTKTADDEPKSPAPPPPDIKPDEDAEVVRIKEDLYQQLHKTRTEDIASRKKTFKFLCLRWHPDKNQEKLELATAVFQFLQQQRDWYLKDA